jgi:uncharacterized protein (DUF488 family)
MHSFLVPSDPSTLLAHYKALCTTLQKKLETAEEDIADFTDSSKELQRELEKELETMEMAERGLRREMEQERDRADEWKVSRTCSFFGRVCVSPREQWADFSSILRS